MLNPEVLESEDVRTWNIGTNGYLAWYVIRGDFGHRGDFCVGVRQCPIQ